MNEEETFDRPPKWYEKREGYRGEYEYHKYWPKIFLAAGLTIGVIDLIMGYATVVSNSDLLSNLTAVTLIPTFALLFLALGFKMSEDF